MLDIVHRIVPTMLVKFDPEMMPIIVPFEEYLLCNDAISFLILAITEPCPFNVFMAASTATN